MKKAPDSHASQNSLNFAWQVHNQQQAWIEKADFKASMLLPVQLGILTILGAVLTNSRSPHLNLINQICILLGMLIVVTAMVLTTLVVMPRLGGGAVEECDLIYFGHLRSLDESTIKARLADLDNDAELSALSRQLSVLSKLNWNKHRLIQCGIFATSIGAALCLITLLISWLFL